MKMIFFLFIAVLAILFTFLLSNRNWHEKQRRFRSRDELSLDELFYKYFTDCGIEIDVFQKIIIELASTLHVPAGKLRPTDRFDKELKAVNSFDWDNDDLVSLFYERIWKKTGKKTKELPEIKTLGDYIKAMKQYL
jgi:hypothetical protein